MQERTFRSFVSSMFSYDTFQKMNNKSADQTANLQTGLRCCCLQTTISSFLAVWFPLPFIANINTIIKLFALCKGSNFNILGVVPLFHLLKKGNQVLFIIC